MLAEYLKQRNLLITYHYIIRFDFRYQSVRLTIQINPHNNSKCTYYTRLYTIDDNRIQEYNYIHIRVCRFANNLVYLHL